MATLTTWRAYSRERADRLLDLLERDWASIPEVVAEWPSLGEADRLVYDERWAIAKGNLRLVRDWADRGLLSPQQEGRYEELLGLVEQHRPALVRLIEEEAPDLERKAA